MWLLCVLPVCVFWFVVLGVGLCGRGRGVVSVGWVCGVFVGCGVGCPG